MSKLGAVLEDGGTTFFVWSGSAERMWACLFDENGNRETDRIEMTRGEDGLFTVHINGISAGQRYGLRADGPYQPAAGRWFDPDKLLVDPYATRVDRAYVYDPRLAAARGSGIDTAPLMPKCIVETPQERLKPGAPVFEPGGLIYEVQARGFTKLHPGIPEKLRGTIAALGHPVIIDHLVGLGVSAVELMPVTAWIDERHLPSLRLANAWGYNPVSFMALDPRLAPGGIAELREAVRALREAGIGVILDLVFNHTGESDEFGPTLSLRGLDAEAYFRREPGPPSRLVNDTGTGNTLACDHPAVQRLVLDSLHYFVQAAGVDGFRFDLAPVLGRSGFGFDADAPLLKAIAADPVLADRVLIAEPWDIGLGGYQLGSFHVPWLEWNDRYRDDIRRFWRGDRGAIGTLATRLAGSADTFPGKATRTVNFIAAHDGFSLADLVAYERKHNEANGEQNRDGHSENFSWNNGIEGETSDRTVTDCRAQDLRALLATLFMSRGTIMLTAGDEFGRTQHGNNNAYAQDNATTWIDWSGRDLALEAFSRSLGQLRKALPEFREVGYLTGLPAAGNSVSDVEWLTETGAAMTEDAWNDPERRRLLMVLSCGAKGRLAFAVNGDRRACVFAIPGREGHAWRAATDGAAFAPSGPPLIPGRSAHIFLETAE